MAEVLKVIYDFQEIFQKIFIDCILFALLTQKKQYLSYDSKVLQLIEKIMLIWEVAKE